MRLILCTRIRPWIGTENLIPEEVNYTKITIRVPVMNKVQFLLASESCSHDAAVNALKEVSHKWSNGRLTKEVIFGARDAVEAWLKALAEA